MVEAHVHHGSRQEPSSDFELNRRPVKDTCYDSIWQYAVVNGEVMDGRSPRDSGYPQTGSAAPGSVAL